MSLSFPVDTKLKDGSPAQFGVGLYSQRGQTPLTVCVARPVAACVRDAIRDLRFMDLESER
jgi:hypothetical protein